MLIASIIGAGDIEGQTTSNPNGFESGSIVDWAGAAGTETAAINSTTVRTGTKSLALTTSSAAANKYWYSHSPYGQYAAGSYVHFIYWAKALAAGTSVDASLRYDVVAPPTAAGTVTNGTTTALSTATWTQIKYNTANVAGRWYFPSPRKTSANATTFYIDDLIVYTSNSNTTDIIAPSAPTGALGNNVDGLSWTNGIDSGTGATGIQATLIFKRTAGVNGSNDLTLNNQAIYSLIATEGPSVVGNWTLVNASVAPTATTYNSGTFTAGVEYAIVHRDFAYNYSNRTYVVISASTFPAVTTQAVSSITKTTATGNGSIVYTGNGITTSGICWNTATTPTTANNKTTNGPTAIGSYTGAITGLTPNTLYYVRAYATTAGGTGYGLQQTFTTVPNAPTVANASNPTAFGFHANWTAPTGQGSDVFTYEVQVTATSGNYTTLASDIPGISSSNLSQTITGLNPITTYYYRVRTTNAGGQSEWSAESAAITTLTQTTLTVNITPVASGSVTGNAIPLTSGVGKNFTTNEVVTLQATPAFGEGFLRWIIDGTDRNGDNPLNITMSENETVSAQFGDVLCSSYDFEDVLASQLSTTAYVAATFTSNGDTWNTIDGRLNQSSAYAYGGSSQSIFLQYATGALITPAVSRPVSLSFWARIYNTGGYATTVKVYISTDGGTTYNPTEIFSGAVPTNGTWLYCTTNISTTSTNVRLKILNSGGTSSNFRILIDALDLCVGPDAIPPTLTFNPTNLSTNISTSADLTITSNEKLYRYVPNTGAFIPLNVGDAAFSNADTLATILSLKRVSDNADIPFTVNIDATGQILTIHPTSNFDYLTDYKLSIQNVSDGFGNVLSSTQYSQFTTRIPPSPVISVTEVSTGDSFATGSTFNMGTIFSAGTITKTFRIYNIGSDPLTVTSCNLTTGTKYAKTLSPATTVNPGASTDFTIVFNPGATGGVYTDVITIVNNDLLKPNFTINLTGIKGTFVLPYTYQSACSAPVMSPTELTHDYSSLSDIPGEITLKNGVALTAANFYHAYKVFQGEGNCMPSGSSALKVGQGANGLQIVLPSCGQITLKWCSNGYRKVRITDNSGNLYEQSPSYLPSCTCYTTSTVVNTPNPVTINIEFLGNDPALLTTLYYLQITPYSASIQSSADNIVGFSTGVSGENVRIYDNIIFVSVPAATDLSTITPSLIQASPFATVSPTQGVQQDFSTGAVTYTVTAQNGSTKTYSVRVEHAVDYGTSLYADSIAIPVDMNRTDKKLEVVEITNSACQVPLSGNGSNYTIHFLDPTDMPIGGYKIAGPSKICIGTIGEYTLKNAPGTNSPSYAWKITGANKNLFTIIGDTISNVLRLKAPDIMTEGTIDFSVIVEFDPSQCVFLRGEDHINIGITDQPPTPITGITANCTHNGLLTVTADGSTDATSYNWTFTPAIPIVTQDENSIVLNIGASSNDISAQVNTQNGCGITLSTSNYDIPYAKEWTKWTGAVDNDWSRNANWTDRVPKACTDVVIPDVGNGVQYPIIGPSGECHYITFEPGGAVLGLQKLTYERAYVQLESQRQKWYTLTAPLKNMYSGDYAYEGGSPVTDMRLFDVINPDSISKGGALNVGNWSRQFSAGNVDLTPGIGYAYWVDTKTYNYPNPITYETGNKTIYFPRETSPNNLLTLMHTYSTYSGRLLTSISLPRDSNIAYRFSMENAGNVLQDIHVSIKPGLNLVGNPLMTHLDFNALRASNTTVISNKVKFWNGTTFNTFMSGSDISSSMDLTSSSISPMQAFFVEGLKNGTMDIDLETHFFVDLTTKLRSASIKPNLMYIKTNNGLKQSSAAIAMRPNTSNSYGDDDAFKLFSQFNDVPEVYTLADDVALDINQFDTLPYRVPVGLKTTKLGNVNFTFNGAESFNNIDVTLLNIRTGEQQNLKTSTQYNLQYDGSKTDDYLFIEFRNANANTTPTETKDVETCGRCIQVYQKDSKTIGVVSPRNDKIRNITVWEESGKMLFNKFDINQSLYDVEAPPHHSCVVRVATEASTYVVKLLMK